tara:strand:- start:74 stop:1060 length:987 start_codon:yes stop_codon:yes gene_type:complete
MKILYGIQGTGNGHLSRGDFIYTLLKKYTNDVDVLISGDNYSLKPKMPIKYKNKGVTFSINNGSIDYFKTLVNLDLFTSFFQQQKIPFKNYDLIITDFEPITAWASIRYKIPSIHISHQAAFINNKAPRPADRNIMGEYILKYFCPANDYIGLHYRSYGPNISEPIILEHICNCEVEEKEHITVYLPWYEDDYLFNFFKEFDELKFHIFSKKTTVVNQIGNILVYPISKLGFLESMRTSLGVICNSGFQTTSEVLYLGKRLLTIPVKGQYEQMCNVAALNEIGVMSLTNLNNKSYDYINDWLISKPIKINFKNNLEELLLQKINRMRN